MYSGRKSLGEEPAMGIVEQHGEGIPGRDRSGWDGEITVIREVGRGQVAQRYQPRGDGLVWF